jgi:hypothetical protein
LCDSIHISHDYERICSRPEHATGLGFQSLLRCL